MTRFRYPTPLIILTVLALFVAIFGFAFEGGFLLLVPVIPLIALFLLLRVGTDVNANGIRVRSPMQTVIVLWPNIAELRPDRFDRAVAVLTDGGMVKLLAVKASDLPRVVAASGKTRSEPDAAVEVSGDNVAAAQQ